MPPFNFFLERILDLQCVLISAAAKCLTYATLLPIFFFNPFVFPPNEASSFPDGAVVKNPPTNTWERGEVGLIPGSGRSPGGGHGNPLSYSCLGNPMDRGPWWAIVHGAAKELDKEIKQQNWSSRDAGCLLWNLTVVLCPSWITSFVLLPEGDPEASAVTQWKLLEERRVPLHLFLAHTILSMVTDIPNVLCFSLPFPLFSAQYWCCPY